MSKVGLVDLLLQSLESFLHHCTSHAVCRHLVVSRFLDFEFLFLRVQTPLDFGDVVVELHFGR